MSVPWIITDVEPRHDYVLFLTFADGTQGEIDMGPRIWVEAFAALRSDVALFRSVFVHKEAGTVAWPTGADYAPDALYEDLQIILSGRPDPEISKV